MRVFWDVFCTEFDALMETSEPAGDDIEGEVLAPRERKEDPQIGVKISSAIPKQRAKKGKLKSILKVFGKVSFSAVMSATNSWVLVSTIDCSVEHNYQWHISVHCHQLFQFIMLSC